MKLGLIAMSGVRANDPELTALGLTLPGFVERNKLIASLPSLGLLTLAGLTPDAVDTRYLEVPDLDAQEGVPGEFDLVAISSFSAKIKDAYALADRYRALGTQVVLGGLHVTVCPDEAAQHADAIVIGEGEPSWPRLMHDALNGGLQARYDSRPESFNFAHAPMPRFDLLSDGVYNRITVQTQRGCPYRCEFCAASIRLTPHYKVKPVEKVVAEIEAIQEIWPNSFIEFADDNTFVNKAHSKDLMRAIEPLGIRWFTETDISVAEDEELLQMMADSGCAQVLVGLESPAAHILEGVEQNINWKARQRDRYCEAIARIQSHGITVNGCFVLGLDGSTHSSFDEVFRFVEDSGLYEVQVTVQTAFPGTPLYERLRREGRLLREGGWEFCTLFDVNFQPDCMSVAELESGFRSLVERLYSESQTASRRSAVRRRWREQGGRHAAAPPVKEAMRETYMD